MVWSSVRNQEGDQGLLKLLCGCESRGAHFIVRALEPRRESEAVLQTLTERRPVRAQEVPTTLTQQPCPFPPWLGYQESLSLPRCSVCFPLNNVSTLYCC